MLQDIVKITKKVFRDALIEEKNLNSPKNVYVVYKNLSAVIDDVKLVANHYLALDFTEGYLQDSSWGEPVDKWRMFFNKDLESLNKSVKNYLRSIASLCFEDELDTVLSKYYRCKSYYGFVRDSYNIGFVEPCGSNLHITSLDTKSSDINSVHLAEHEKIDLTTFESKKELQTELLLKNEKLQEQLLKLKQYIQNRYTLDDLL
jgi:hypothetical protein